jgi:LPXTG-motif cell wall-anchored protein
MNKLFFQALVAGAIALGLLAGSCSSVRKSVRTEKHLVDSTVQEETAVNNHVIDKNYQEAESDSSWRDSSRKEEEDRLIITLDPDSYVMGRVDTPTGGGNFVDSGFMVRIIPGGVIFTGKVPTNTKSIELRQKRSQADTKTGELTRSDTFSGSHIDTSSSLTTKKTEVKKTDEIKTKDKKRTGVSAGFWITGGAILALGLLFFYWRRRRQQSKPFF